MASTFHKLGLLKDQADLFICDFQQYIRQIIVAGESWNETEDNQVKYLQLDTMIDTAVEFIKENSEKLSNASAVFAANNRSRLSSEQPEVPLPSATAAISDRPAATPRASPRTILHRQPPESALPADETQLKQVLDRLAALEEGLSSLRGSAENLTKQVSLDQEHERRLQTLEKQLEKFSASQDRMKVEIKSQAEQTDKLVHMVPDQLESVKETLDKLDARIDRIVDDCRNNDQDRVNAIIDNFKAIWTNEKMAVFKELEQTVLNLERDMKIINKQDKIREANLDYLIREVAGFLPRLQQLELKSSQTGCGFSAEASFTAKQAYNTVGQYTTLYSTASENFDADSGIFTAPVDGLYVASISLCLAENEELEFSVRHKQSLYQVSSTTVCECSAEIKGTTTCGLGVVGMKAGEVLMTIVYQKDTNDYFKRVSFSCFLSGRV